jgi:hypothetical protein
MTEDTKADTAPEPTMEELLDNTPEAVAMRRMRAARAEAAARKAEEAEKPAAPSSLRRKLVVGAVLGLATVARVAGRAGGRGVRKP